jgi:hypothetical protein
VGGDIAIFPRHFGIRRAQGRILIERRRRKDGGRAACRQEDIDVRPTSVPTKEQHADDGDRRAKSRRGIGHAQEARDDVACVMETIEVIPGPTGTNLFGDGSEAARQPTIRRLSVQHARADFAEDPPRHGRKIRAGRSR